jgi:hypothetical protein
MRELPRDLLKRSESRLAQLIVNSSGCLTAGLRADTILSTGRAQAANSAGFRFGAGLISGFAVGGL